MIEAFAKMLEENGIQEEQQKLKKIVSLLRERVNFLHELHEQSAFIFEAPTSYDEKFAKKKWKADTPALMSKVAERLAGIKEFNVENINKSLHGFMEEEEVGAGKIMPGLRLALVGIGSGPDVKEIMAILGKEEVIQRIRKAIANIAAD